MRRATGQAKRGSGLRAAGRFALLVAALGFLAPLRVMGAESQLKASAPHAPQAVQPAHVIVISIPDRMLALTEDGRVLKIFPVAVGKDLTPSPAGTWKVVNKVVNPTYYHSGRAIRPGRYNPLGDRWMGLSEKGYGIHGTNAPGSIGHAVSHGCIRMHKRDVEELFRLVRVGDVVEIRGERDALVAATFSSGHPPADECRLKQDLPLPVLQSSLAAGEAGDSDSETPARGNGD